MNILWKSLLRIGRRCYRLFNFSTTQRFILLLGIQPYVDKLHWWLLQRTIKQVQSIQVNGVETNFLLSTFNEFSRVRNGRQEERPVLEKICEMTQKGNTFWDVGSCTGVFAVTIANVHPGSTVIAFEPYPPNRNSIVKNADLNGCDVDVRSEALSNQAGTDVIETQFAKGAGSQQATIDSDYSSTPKAQDRSEVTLLPGDEVVRIGISKPDVIKIDVEGHAPEVIDGMPEYLRPDNCRVVIVEPHNNSEKLREKLGGRGYKITTIELGGDRGQRDEPTLIAT